MAEPGASPAGRALFYPGAPAYAERASLAAAEAQAALPSKLDVAYGPDPRQKLDIYWPAGVDHPLPVLCFFHGGGWMAGERRWVGLMAPAITGLPAILVAPAYRLAPAHPWPQPLDDCRAAVEWIGRHIGEFGGDPKRLFIGGHSAGAHLAARLVVGADWPETVRVRGCLPVSGSYDLRFASPEPGSMEERINHNLLPHPGDAEDASPLLKLSSSLPPFLLAWGEHDLPRAVRQGDAMRQELQAHGVTAEALVLNDQDHFGAHEACGRPDGEWMAAVQRWMLEQGREN